MSIKAPLNTPNPEDKPLSLGALFYKSLSFGLQAWGGPSAQIHLMKADIVDKEKWISKEQFKKTLGLYQLLPGPEASELAVYFGMIKRGPLGGIVSGMGFILPGFIIMLLISILYKLEGAVALLPWLIGLKPAVFALMFRSSFNLSKEYITNTTLIILSILAIALTLINMNAFVILITLSLFYSFYQIPEKQWIGYLVLAGVALFYETIQNILLIPLYKTAHIDVLIEGLKAGLLTFGGAYTAIPFLENSLVIHSGVLSKDVFLNGIAFAHLIPSPLVMFGTFFGYQISGLSGAIGMTLGIFAPAFLISLIGHSYFEKLIKIEKIHHFLEGITGIIISMLWVSTLEIGQEISHTKIEITMGIICLFILFKSQKKITIPLIMIASAIIGKYLL